MTYLSRRSMLRGSLALAAAHPFVGPHIAKAAATTASVWFTQGFVQDEDVALRKAVADYEKQSSNKIELSIIPYAPERQKIISALTSGVVPDLCVNNPAEILQIYGWQDRWVEVTDVVETQRAQFSETALLGSQAYNSVIKKRLTYGVPLRAAVIPDFGHANNVILASWIEGEPEKSWWQGMKTKGRRRFSITAYRCTKCGFLETYAATPVT